MQQIKRKYIILVFSCSGKYIDTDIYTMKASASTSEEHRKRHLTSKLCLLPRLIVQTRIKTDDI